MHEVGHLLALDNSDAYSANVSFTHANDTSPYPPYETSTLDCFNPEWGVVLGTPADAEQARLTDLPCISPVSPLYLHCISTVSPLHLVQLDGLYYAGPKLQTPPLPLP